MAFLFHNRQKVNVRSLQIHATQACNLACDGCTSFSQFKLKGMLTPLAAKEWFDAWRKRIQPEKVCLLGGEPTINPDLCELLEMMGKSFPSPHTKRLLTTNAFFLDRHPDLRTVLRRFKIEIRISIHSDEPDYLEKIKIAIREVETWKGVSKLFTNNSGKPIPGFKFNDEKWTQRYIVNKDHILPFDDKNPRKSWEVCTAKMNLQLFDSKLWKCPIITYLRLVSPEKLPKSVWQNYLKYKPLEPTCSDEELRRFVSREEEEICGMCPSTTISFAKANPF